MRCVAVFVWICGYMEFEINGQSDLLPPRPRFHVKGKGPRGLGKVGGNGPPRQLEPVVLPGQGVGVASPDPPPSCSHVDPGAPKALPAVLAQLGVQHFYTLVQHPSDETCIYYDFLPADPESPLTMASIISGQSVQGIIQERKLRMPPRRRCWLVGKTGGGRGLESAQNFNTQWDSRLSLFHNCRHYSNDLVQHLTGEKDMISRLDVLKSRTGLERSEASTSSDEDWAMIDTITVNDRN